MERLLWWTSVLSVVLIVMVLTALRRAHIRVEYSVTWLIAGVALFALSRSETALGWIASALGLGYAPTVLVLVAGFILGSCFSGLASLSPVCVMTILPWHKGSPSWNSI